jgi:hypothetical protein
MLYTAKWLLAPVAAMAIVSNLGCRATLEEPYQPVSISDLVSEGEIGSRVSVSGMPLECGLGYGNEICPLIDSGHILYLKRTNSLGKNSDFTAAETAFNDEANDGDLDRVTAYGVYQGGNVVVAEYFKIDDTLYPVEQ